MVMISGTADLNFDDLVRSRLAEARNDAVALDEIIEQGRGWYSLEGDALDRFVKRMVSELITAGMAVVVQTPEGTAVDWTLNPAYQLPIRDAIDRLIHDWKNSPDGYAYFAWFTDPNNLNPEKVATKRAGRQLIGPLIRRE